MEANRRGDQAANHLSPSHPPRFSRLCSLAATARDKFPAAPPHHVNPNLGEEP
jgi:hypothetical protein